MFRYAIAVVAVFIGATLIACGQPKLEVIGGETYDWGKVKPPKEGYLEAEIKMKNAGTDGLLKLVEIKPGCGCTKTDPDKTELNAGEISTMKVRLNISPTQSGPLTKSITVRHTGGADTTTTYLFLKADIQRALQLSPTVFLSFTDMRVGQEASAKIEITNNDSRPITLSDVVTDNNLIVNIGGAKTLQPGQKFEIVARTVPTMKGSYTAKVTFKTNHPDHPTMDIMAYGMVMEYDSPVFQKTPNK
jgi:hypothetical protein